jgi:HEAT repeat protein
MLGELQAKPDSVIPKLAKLVRDPDGDARYRAIVALEKFGTNARPAVADLLPALNDTARGVRQAATNALRAIESGKPTNGLEEFRLSNFEF